MMIEYHTVEKETWDICQSYYKVCKFVNIYLDNKSNIIYLTSSYDIQIVSF